MTAICENFVEKYEAVDPLREIIPENKQDGPLVAATKKRSVSSLFQFVKVLTEYDIQEQN